MEAGAIDQVVVPRAASATGVASAWHRVAPEVGFLGLALLVWGTVPWTSGFVFALDMVWPEHWIALPDYGRFAYSYPLQYVLLAAQEVLPLWVVQKVVLVCITWACFAIAYRCLPVPDHAGARLVAALLYGANPFVYARLLVGHWMIVAAYALLPWLLSRLLLVSQRRSARAGAAAALVLACIAVWSAHVFVLGVGVAVAWLIGTALDEARDRALARAWLRPIGALAGTLALLTSYWTVPLFGRNAPEVEFTWSEWQAFAPLGSSTAEVYAKLLTLSGFWNQGNGWGDSFSWPDDAPWFVPVALALGVVIAAGARALYRADKRLCFFLLTLALVALVLAPGAAPTPFAAVSRLLAEHVPMWSGFRDSQKLVVLLSLAWATFAGFGVAALLDRASQPSQRGIVVATAAVLCVALTPQLYFDLGEHVRVARYPAGWQRVAETLQREPEGARMLVLPWHRYMHFRFVDAVIDHPAYFYYSPRAIVCRDDEIGSLPARATDPLHERIDRFFASRSSTSTELASALAGADVTLVARFEELGDTDPHRYDFLGGDGFSLLFRDADVALYRVRLPGRTFVRGSERSFAAAGARKCREFSKAGSGPELAREGRRRSATPSSHHSQPTQSCEGQLGP